MGIEPDLVAVLAVASSALSVLLLVAVVVLALRLRVVRRTQRRLFARGEGDIVSRLDANEMELASLRDAVRQVHSEAGGLRARLQASVSRVAVVRYDAFDDMGGALSFSAALLDDHGRGLVVSAINGRSETRCYAKPIVSGQSEHSLTEEEVEAVSAAIEGRTASDPPPGRRRRRRAS